MEPNQIHKLALTELRKGFFGITPDYGAILAEASAICFSDQNHPNGVQLKVDGAFTSIYSVFWPEVTDQMLRCWNDPDYTTEQGAYGVAFLLVLDLTGCTVISRSRKGTGFDYWLGKNDEDELPFQNKARLEVSGIRNGSYGQVKSRAKQKLEQVKASDSTSLPAYIIIVEFHAPLSHVVKNEPN